MYKAALLLLSVVIALYAYIAFALSVDNSVTLQDEIAIKSLMVDKACAYSQKNFNEEIVCITSIQAAVQNVGQEGCSVKSDIVEPLEFLKRGYGCCFDRARFIEKAARYYGFSTRHVFLIQPKYSISLSNLLPLEQSSHAVSEILTSKGWLGVGSVDPFLLLDENQDPYTYRDTIDNLNEFPSIHPKFFYFHLFKSFGFGGTIEDLDLIYGLYSRNGNFHGKNFPGPEYVFSELLWNLW